MSVKLYKHNESGEIVAAILNKKSQEFRVFHNNGYVYTSEEEWFIKKYTPLPEAPEVGSTAWDEYDLKAGLSTLLNKHSVENDSNTPDFVLASLLNGFLKLFGDVCRERDKWYGTDSPWIESTAEAPKPLVEGLPHGFVEGQEVLVRDSSLRQWKLYTFEKYVACVLSFSVFINKEKTRTSCFSYCIPYAENEHLEGTVTDGEHGAVPKGYVPPHVPQLGDETYWVVGDEIINLFTGKSAIVTKVTNECVELDYDGLFASISLFGAKGKGLLRGWYHKGSYIRVDGIVHEHIPTRPHRIES